MIKDAFVVDAAAHSYNLGEDDYAVGRYSQAVVDASYGAHYNLSSVGYRLPREHFTRDWTVAETAKMLYVESDYDYACHHVIPINAFKDGRGQHTESPGKSRKMAESVSGLCWSGPPFLATGYTIDMMRRAKTS
jgi:hypothetical protein